MMKIGHFWSTYFIRDGRPLVFCLFTGAWISSRRRSSHQRQGRLSAPNLPISPALVSGRKALKIISQPLSLRLVALPRMLNGVDIDQSLS